MKLQEAIKAAVFDTPKNNTELKPAEKLEKPKPIFRFVTPGGSESIGYWRIGMPYVGVHKLGFYGVITNQIPSPNELLAMDKTENAHTMAVVTHLTYMRGTLDKLNALWRAGVPLIVDVDDYIWAWGRLTASQLKEFNRTLEIATVVTTTTEYLQKKIKEHAGVNAVILPNTMPEEEFRPPIARTPDERLRVIYTGGITHETEWGMIRDMVDATASFADWIIFHGQQLDKTGRFQQLVTPAPLIGAQNILWQIPQQPQVFLRTAYNTRPHVSVAPLAYTKMNTAKSDLKILEAGALGIPCVTQKDSEPYKNWPLKGNTVNDFVGWLELFNEDEELRSKWGERTVDYAWERRLQGEQYMAALLEAYSGIR